MNTGEALAALQVGREARCHRGHSASKPEMQTAFAITDEYSRAFEQRDSSDPRSRDDTLDDDRDTPRAISNEEVFGREWVEGVE